MLSTASENSPSWRGEHFFVTNIFLGHNIGIFLNVITTATTTTHQTPPVTCQVRQIKLRDNVTMVAGQGQVWHLPKCAVFAPLFSREARKFGGFGWLQAAKHA
jgi:hypothetical protein